MDRFSVTSLFGISLLLFGLGAGVLLVQQNQQFRERADEVKQQKVAICHKTGSESNQWVQIEVSENAKDAHMAHGDIQGNCPTQDDGGGDGDNGSGGGDGGSGGGGVQLANNVTVNNETNTVGGIEIIVEKEYIYVTTRFDFWIKFQGIDEKRDNKTVRVIFRKGDEELHVYNFVTVQSDNEGIYSGTITDVRPGTYEVLIKSDGYLQRKIEDVTLVRGRNRFYWDDRELLAGDFDGDNDLDGKDVAEFFSFFVAEQFPVSEETAIFDITFDKLLDINDISPVLENYKMLVILGDS